MAHYILQPNNQDLDTEYMIIKELLRKNRLLHSYIEVNKNDINKVTQENDFRNSIVIGEIPYVTKFLHSIYGIEKQNPIEIPEYLRTDEFLKRDYKIIPAKDLPRAGYKFIKDVDNLKTFAYTGYIENLNIDEMLKESSSEHDLSMKIDPDTSFAVSSIFNIQSEYRVYVIDNKIEAISNYDGDCTIFPDINLIKKMSQLINYNEKWLKSYTLDVMVGKNGTAIIEVHNFTSIGLYSNLWGDNLLFAYRQGIDYIINDNHKLVK